MVMSEALPSCVMRPQLVGKKNGFLDCRLLLLSHSLGDFELRITK